MWEILNIIGILTLLEYVCIVMSMQALHRDYGVRTADSKGNVSRNTSTALTSRQKWRANTTCLPNHTGKSKKPSSDQSRIAKQLQTLLDPDLGFRGIV